MKIGVWVEGASDGAFYPSLISRILVVNIEDIKVLNRRGRCICGLKPGLKNALKDFDACLCTHIVLSADNHDALATERNKFISCIGELVAPRQYIISVAIEELEGWLLADYVTLCKTLNKPLINKPPAVEDIKNQKTYLREKLGETPNAKHLIKFASKMNLEVASRESKSFARFISELEKWKK